MSWVADEKPNITAAIAVKVNELVGSEKAMAKIEMIMATWLSKIQPLRLPKVLVNPGIDKLSTSGAQINLKE